MRLTSRSDQYFATLEDEEELAAEIWDRVSDFYTRMRGRTFYRRAAESFRMYYGLPTPEDPFDVTQIGSGGPTGSNSTIKVNHYYSLGQGLVTMATHDRPDWVAVPTNADAKSIQDKMLGQKLLDYYMREKGISAARRQSVESAVVMQVGYVLLTWNPSAGRQLTPEVPPDPESGDPGMPATYEGDIEVSALTPFDVPLDLEWRGSGERPWVITRALVDKWELAEQFPAHRDDILNAWIDRSEQGLDAEYLAGTSFDGENTTAGPNKDQVAVFTLWHRKTKAVPGGKMVMVVNGRTCLFNGGLPYGDHLPLHPVAPAIRVGSTLGHTPMINLMSIQKAISAAWSAPVTNLSLFGAGSLLVPKGSGMNVSDMGGGAMAIEWDGEKEPKPLNVPAIQQPAIEMAKELVRTAEVISGVAPVVRGNASAELSGAAQLFQLQTATDYASGLIEGVTEQLESIGNALIEILKTYATAPRLALIVGKNKAPMLREFKNSDIAGIATVKVNVSNAVRNTPQGRLTMADSLLEKGLITAQQYICIADNGALEEDLSAATTQRALIARENEMLSTARQATPEEEAQGLGTPICGLDGMPVPGPDGRPLVLFGIPKVLATDNHDWHLAEHPTVLDSIEMRENPFAMYAVMHHMGQHKGFKSAPEGGIPPVPPPGAMPPPGMDPNPPPAPLPNPNANGGGPGPDGNAPPPAPKQPGPGGPAGPKMPQPPQMPKNLSGGPMPGSPAA